MADVEENNDNNDKNPWDQREGETSAWFRRFRIYLAIPGKRGIVKACNEERESESEAGVVCAPAGWYVEARKRPREDSIEVTMRTQTE